VAEGWEGSRAEAMVQTMAEAVALKEGAWVAVEMEARGALVMRAVPTEVAERGTHAGRFQARA